MGIARRWRLAVAPLAVIALSGTLCAGSLSSYADDQPTQPAAATEESPATETTTPTQPAPAEGDTDAPEAVEPAPAPAEESSPTGACADLVTTPDILATDRTPDGGPIQFTPSPSGKITPVIFVHGWVSWVTHDEERTGYFSHYINKTANGHAGIVLSHDKERTSLIGLIQQIPGAAPYLFDYSKVASRWVTDPEIGPKLGRAVTCLAKHYGVKPVIVAHSMGGNATREALAQQDGEGGLVGDHVSRVITFGTPNTGSDNAALLGKIIDGAGKPLLLGAPARLVKHMLEKCGEGMDAEGKPCLGNPVIDAFYSQGGKALRTGSPEMKVLPAWPKNVHVTALAGDIQLGGISMFGWDSKRAIDLGDMLVSEESALAGSTDNNVVRCEYGIVSTHSVSDGIKLIGGLIKGTDRPATLASTPCWHEALLRETTQTGIARDIITAYATQPVADSQTAAETH